MQLHYTMKLSLFASFPVSVLFPVCTMSYGRHRQEEVECYVMHMGGLEYTFLHESPINTPGCMV